MKVTSLVRHVLTVALFFGVSVSSPVSAQIQSRPRENKLDSAVRASLKGNAPTQRVIITTTPATRASIVRALRAHGDSVRRIHGVIGAVSAEVHSADVEELEQNPSIQRISADSPVRASGSFLRFPARLPAPWLDSSVRTAVGLKPGSPTGSSVRVAIIDSGIAPIANLSGRIDGFYDFTNGGFATPP
jgi:hypothetical protein